MLQSPISKLYTAILNRIKTNAIGIRFISQDLGQLEFYDNKPNVSFPCVLIDVGELNFEEGLHNLQIATATITLRLALTTYSDVSSLTTAEVRGKGLEYYELEHRLCNLLHNWRPEHDEIGAIIRTATATEKRDDNIRVRQITFSTSLQYDADALAPTETPLQVNFTIN
jgi:hypothetical protein